MEQSGPEILLFRGAAPEASSPLWKHHSPSQRLPVRMADILRTQWLAFVGMRACSVRHAEKGLVLGLGIGQDRGEFVQQRLLVCW